MKQTLHSEPLWAGYSIETWRRFIAHDWEHPSRAVAYQTVSAELLRRPPDGLIVRYPFPPAALADAGYVEHFEVMDPTRRWNPNDTAKFLETWRYGA